MPYSATNFRRGTLVARCRQKAHSVREPPASAISFCELTWIHRLLASRKRCFNFLRIPLAITLALSVGGLQSNPSEGEPIMVQEDHELRSDDLSFSLYILSRGSGVPD